MILTEKSKPTDMAVTWRLFVTLVLMNCCSTVAKVDMKYDFTFDGRQGMCIYVSFHNYIIAMGS